MADLAVDAGAVRDGLASGKGVGQRALGRDVDPGAARDGHDLVAVRDEAAREVTADESELPVMASFMTACLS